ncbi:MAG: ATP synthase F1 subunit epsilon [Pirellulales bacterium]|nr:ATP synthase F1 subunit epsilon [Pirellulales bacterium]
MQCIVVTPERTVFDRPADFVALTLYDGEIGIAPQHAPMIGRLGCGEMRVAADGQTDRYYVEGGFVEVLDDVVSVLTRHAVAAGELDEAVIAERLFAARSRRATNPEAIEIRDRAVFQARAQLHVARRA